MARRCRSGSLWLAALGLLVSSCSSGPGPAHVGGGSGGGGGGGGTPVTPADRAAAIAGAQKLFQTLVDAKTDRSTRETRLASYLQAQHGVVATGVAPGGDVWAQFSDKQYYHLLDGSDPTRRTVLPAPAMAQPAKGPAPVGRQVRAAGPDGAVPESKQARILLGMGAGFPTQDADIERLLEHAGYTVIRRAASIENYRSVANDGVFFLYTHGGIGQYSDTHATWWDLWTTDKVTEANDALYAADLADGSLLRATAIEDVVNNRWVMGSHYCITLKFIRKYQWSFAKGAAIVLNACHSFESGACASMVASPGQPGAAIGWSATMACYQGEIAAAMLFDRMLGTNEYYPEALPQRPMIASQGIANVNGQHYSGGGASVGDATYDPAHPAFLQEAVGDGDPVLAPSNQKMVLHERLGESPIHGKTKLHLIGWFGDKQGKVTIGGTEIPVTEWKRDHIDCQPADLPGAGFSGEVQVSTGDSREGNAIPLTYWHGKLTYDIDLLPSVAASAHSRIACDVYLRGDVHQFREAGGGPLYFADPVKFRAAQGSKVHWSVLGSPPQPASFVGPTSSDLPFGLNGTANPPYGTGYIVSGVIDTYAKTALFSFNFLDCVTSYQVVGTPGPATALATLHDVALTSQPSGIDPSDGYPIYATNLANTIGTDFVIPAKTLTGQTPILNPKLKFDDFLATNQPEVSRGEDER